MAIWQLHFQLVPIGGKAYDRSNLLSDASVSVLTVELPQTASWCEDNILFGDLDTTCVEIFLLNDTIDETSVRLDVTNLSKKQLDTIIQFAQLNNLQILYNEKTIAATADNVYTLIRQSDAIRFLENPQQFLTELSGNNK